MGLGLLDELGHIIAGGQIQLSHQLAVHRVFHHHRLHSAAVVHHQVQLLLHLALAVAAGHRVGAAGGGMVQHIPPGGGGDVGPRGPQQGHVPHNDLAADLEGVGQSGGGQGAVGLGEIF